MQRENFSGRFGVLVAMAGSAIGLGNLWRFPYMVGTNGGAAFIFVYILFVFLLSLPILFSEFIVGHPYPCSRFPLEMGGRLVHHYPYDNCQLL